MLRRQAMESRLRKDKGAVPILEILPPTEKMKLRDSVKGFIGGEISVTANVPCLFKLKTSAPLNICSFKPRKGFLLPLQPEVLKMTVDITKIKDLAVVNKWKVQILSVQVSEDYADEIEFYDEQVWERMMDQGNAHAKNVVTCYYCENDGESIEKKIKKTEIRSFQKKLGSSQVDEISEGNADLFNDSDLIDEVARVKELQDCTKELPNLEAIARENQMLKGAMRRLKTKKKEDIYAIFQPVAEFFRENVEKLICVLGLILFGMLLEHVFDFM